MFNGIEKPYVSGKINGLKPEEYHLAFDRGARVLRSHGLSPVNPLDVAACPEETCAGPDSHKPDGSYLHSWQCYLKYDLIALMMKCDSIAMLPNYRTSRGAKLELFVARELGYPVLLISASYLVVTKSKGVTFHE